MSNLFDSIFNNATTTVDPVAPDASLAGQPGARDGLVLDL